MSAPAPIPPSLRQTVWTVAWPVVMMGFVKTGYFLTDSYFVGRLGDDALNALGAVTFLWWILVIAVDMAGAGTHAIAAHYTGAGRMRDIAPLATQGLWLGTAVSAACLLLLPFDSLYFDLLRFEQTGARELGSAYIRACLLGLWSFALHAVTAAVFRGLGDTRTPLLIGVFTLLVNVVLDPILIGWMGIAGAAWATSFANLVGGILGFLALHQHGLRPTWSRPVLSKLREIARIGVPVTARGISFSIVYLVLGRLLTPWGEHQLGALAVGHRLEAFPYMTAVGFEVAATTVVGQELGARRPQSAKRAARIAAGLCIAAQLPMGVLLFVFAEPLFAIFSDNPATIATGATYLRLQSGILWAMGLEAVFEGAFTGAANTVPPFWISFIGTWARVPLGYVLAVHGGLGVTGYWVAIAVTTVVKGPIMSLWFHHHGLSVYAERAAADGDRPPEAAS